MRCHTGAPPSAETGDKNSKKRREQTLQGAAVLAASKLGDERYYSGNFSGAIAAYGDALKYLGEKDDAKRASLLANRAACELMTAHKSEDAEEAMPSYRRAVDDCDASLRAVPKNSKALLRRAAAHLALGLVPECRDDLGACSESKKDDVDRVQRACENFDAAMTTLRAACMPTSPSSGKPLRAFLDVAAIAGAAKRANAVARHVQLGGLALSAIKYTKGGDPRTVLGDAIKGKGLGIGFGAPPGAAPPHRAALYAFRARCALKLAGQALDSKKQAKGFVEDALDDVARAATAIGVGDTLLSAEVPSGVSIEDAAYLVRLRARCDLLQAVVLARAGVLSLVVSVARATATLEAGGSPARVVDVDDLEHAEIHADIARADDIENYPQDDGDDESEATPPRQPSSTKKQQQHPFFFDTDDDERPSQSSDPSGSLKRATAMWADYDRAYTTFEKDILPQSPDATLSFPALPLPPDLGSVSGIHPAMTSEDQKKAVRSALLRWHPDKATAFATKFKPDDRDAVIAAAAAVTRRVILEKRALRGV